MPQDTSEGGSSHSLPKSVRGPLLLIGRLYRHEVRPLFDLRRDLDEKGTLEEVERMVEFRGANVWALVFAILIASIGLNVNSTAVIIGAMLISPLMGPIVASGVALGINDFELLKRAIRNLIVATAVSVGTSTLYFLISPLFEAQSELLARIQPTIYDVLIASFGGAIGIIAGTRRDKSLNALSGVAIATALMPPLCTAGFGLANGQPYFALGAAYLFLINCIFICLATFSFVRGLRFKSVAFVDAATERRVRLYMGFFAFLVAVPSVYTGYQTIQDLVFQSNVKRFLSDSFHYRDTKILEKNYQRLKTGDLIEVTLVGTPLPEGEVERIKSRLKAFGLADATLTINEAGASAVKTLERELRQSLRSEMLEKFYKGDQETLKSKEDRIALLERELLKYKQLEGVAPELMDEVSAIAPLVASLRVGLMSEGKGKGGAPSEEPVVLVTWKTRPNQKQRLAVESFLKVRLKTPALKIYSF